jgi:hypothetical protein
MPDLEEICTLSLLPFPSSTLQAWMGGPPTTYGHQWGTFMVAIVVSMPWLLVHIYVFFYILRSLSDTYWECKICNIYKIPTQHQLERWRNSKNNTCESNISMVKMESLVVIYKTWLHILIKKMQIYTYLVTLTIRVCCCLMRLLNTGHNDGFF